MLVFLEHFMGNNRLKVFSNFYLAVIYGSKCNKSHLLNILGTEELPTTYTNGPKDFCTMFFYSLAWIVVHAIIQEYVWDVSTYLLVESA